jgi:hypothetical protein
MYRLSFQDLRTWRRGYEKPRVVVEDFEVEADARVRKQNLQRDGIIACITEAPAPRARKHVDRWQSPTPIQPTLVE